MVTAAPPASSRMPRYIGFVGEDSLFSRLGQCFERVPLDLAVAIGAVMSMLECKRSAEAPSLTSS